MKPIICWITALVLVRGVFAQDFNSASFMNDVLKYRIRDLEKKDDNIVHAETGIFTIKKGVASDYTARRLYPGNVYTIEVFTDPRIQDFKLLVWRSVDGQWQRYDSVNESNRTRLNVQSIGDRETISITPSEEREYAFQLISASYANTTGRYAVWIRATKSGSSSSGSGSSGSGGYSGGSGSSGSGGSGAGGYSSGSGSSGSSSGGSGSGSSSDKKSYLSCDYSSLAWFKKDANDKWVLDGDWTRTDEASMFVVNPAWTVFEHTTPAMKSTYYVQSSKKDGDVYSYEVKSDVGNNYTFQVDLKNSKMDIIGKNSEGRWFVRRWHFKSTWTE